MLFLVIECDANQEVPSLYLLAITYKDKLINCAGIAVFAFYTQ